MLTPSLENPQPGYVDPPENFLNRHMLTPPKFFGNRCMLTLSENSKPEYVDPQEDFCGDFGLLGDLIT
jgi:hypothetical protein